ncbi:MAG: ribonuclease P protein component [Bacteroidales bacterium]|nr:ribonuclease P protein component [Bacteroidales bacterium]
MQTFKKEERLCSRKVISELFEKGNSFTVHPLRTIWLKTIFESHFPAKILIVVPNKNIKKAVDRNKIKRRIKEVYRKHKELLYEHLKRTGQQYVFALIYLDKNIIPFKELEEKIILTLQRLINIT